MGEEFELLQRSPFSVRLAILMIAPLVVVPARGDENWNHPPDEKISGLRHGTFDSASMKVSVGFNIYLPAEYSTPETTRFPLIYYLHGIKGHESSYLAYARLLDRAISAKAIRPMILVFANGGSTSFFSDSPDGSIMGETV